MNNGKYINVDGLRSAMESFHGTAPFDHAIVDDFLLPEYADKIQAQFPEYESPKWFYYKNAIEDKKALNDWNMFPKETYSLFQYLNSEEFVKMLSDMVGCGLYPDNGLHGGGWHMHGTGGNLNPHLDYSLHPKLGLQRKLNIIIYMSRELQPHHGGHLGLWSNDSATNQPGELVHEVAPRFNRAVVFDTTQNSWHGMSRPLVQPEGIYRKSLAIYYLCDPASNASALEKALFAPREEQKGDEAVAELIRKRSDSKLFSQVYRDK